MNYIHHHPPQPLPHLHHPQQHQQQQQQQPPLSPRHILAAQSYFGGAILPQQQQQQQQQQKPTESSPTSSKMNSPHDLLPPHGHQQQSPDDIFLRTLLAGSTTASAAPSDLTFGSSASSGDEHESPPSSFNDFVFDASPLPNGGTSTANGGLSPADHSAFGITAQTKPSFDAADPAASVAAAAAAAAAGSPISLLIQHAQLQQQYIFQQQQQQHYNALRHMSFPTFGVAGPGAAPVNAMPPQQQLQQQQMHQPGVSFDPAMLLQNAALHPAGAPGLPNMMPNGFPLPANMAPGGATMPSQTLNQGSPDRTKAGNKRAKPSSDPSDASQDSQKRARVNSIKPSVPDSSDLFPHLKAGANANAHALIESLKANAASKTLTVKKSPSSEDLPSGSSGRADRKASGASHISPLVKHQKKVAHNAIERRYRNNINDRIAALRNSVPALREYRIRQAMAPADTPAPVPPSKKGRGKGKKKGKDDDDLIDGVSAATKLNKATVLGKATEYIKILKSREIRLQVQVDALRQLIYSLEGGEELLEMWEMQMEPLLMSRIEDATRRIEKEEEDAFIRDAAAAAAGMDGENDNNDDDDAEQEVDDEKESDAPQPGNSLLSVSGSMALPPTSAASHQGNIFASQAPIPTSQPAFSQFPMAGMPFNGIAPGVAGAPGSFSNPFAPFPAGNGTMYSSPDAGNFVNGMPNTFNFAANGQGASPSSGSGHSPSAGSDRSQQQAQQQERGSGSAPRYLMAVFLGFSFLGSASREHHAHHVATGTHASGAELSQRLVQNSGARVMGAGQELVKRMTAAGPSAAILHPAGPIHPHHAYMLAGHGAPLMHAHLPSHVLLFEVLRGVAFVACLLFVAWPYLSLFFRSTKKEEQRDSAKASKDAAALENEERFQRRKSLLSAMSTSRPESKDLNAALRTYVHAPQNLVSSSLQVAALLARLVVAEARSRLRFRSRGKPITDEAREQAAVWCRLFELETSLGSLSDAPGGLVSRLHTLLMVNFLPLERISRLNAAAGLDVGSDVTSPVRVYATKAIALMRIANDELAPLRKSKTPTPETILRLALASQTRKLARVSWARARKAAWRARDVRDESPDSSATPAFEAGLWLEAVLRLQVEEAESLCPSIDSVHEGVFGSQGESAADLSTPTVEQSASQQVTRALFLSPLPAIAAVWHQQQLAKTWSELFANLVRGSCAGLISSASARRRSETASTVDGSPESIASDDATGSKFELDAVTDAAKRTAMTKRVLELVRTAPPAPLQGGNPCSYSNQVLSEVLLATWALVCGNAGLARAVLRRLGSAYTNPLSSDAPISTSFTSVLELDALLSPAASSADPLAHRTALLESYRTKGQPIDEVDALAAAMLGWIAYLRADARLSGGSGGEPDSAENEALPRLGLDIRAYLALAHSSILATATSFPAASPTAASTPSEHQQGSKKSVVARQQARRISSASSEDDSDEVVSAGDDNVDDEVVEASSDVGSLSTQTMTPLHHQPGSVDAFEFAKEQLTDTITLIQRSNLYAGANKRSSEGSDSGVELEGW